DGGAKGGRQDPGFRIGGSQVKAGLAIDGRVTASGEAPTPVDDLAAFVSCLAGFLRPSLDGIAISIAAIPDPVIGLAPVTSTPALTTWIRQLCCAGGLAYRSWC
ncbi:hypothetical protein, partial [Tabrizicola sp.]|uniref:hypothetical protein n=1 Tax=Tabrizicola sp. TaxID=2005166 RepID=UPI00386AADA8